MSSKRSPTDVAQSPSTVVPENTRVNRSDVKAVRRSAPADGWQRTTRETVESVIVAFVLAFLFRTFEAEAFVIPTGSMAPTLQGRHKDLVCPECGLGYRVGASSEVDDDVQRWQAQLATLERDRKIGSDWKSGFAATKWSRGPAPIAASR